ncbi:hypothetical protein ACWCW7_24550 [Nocardia tengchongensis]
MTLPDILAMTTSGRPAPGKKITLPSGAVWEDGPAAGTSLITLPDAEPILLSDNGSGMPNAIVGRSGPFGMLARAFEEVLGHAPGFLTDKVAAQALDLLRGISDADEREVETRIIKFSSKATLLNPGGRRNRPSRNIDDAGEPDDSLFRQTPVRRAQGGRVYRPGDSVAAGGTVSGPGGPTSDSIHLIASRGEYVVNADAAANTLSLLEAINSGWVPSAQFLSGLLHGFSSPVPQGDSAPNPGGWRDMLGQGVIADILGNAGDAALNVSGWAGSALGSALAPLFRPGGPLNSAASTQTGPPVQSPVDSTGAGADLPITASMRATPSGVLGALSGLKLPDGANSPAGDGVTELGSLADALGSGIAGAAAEAGGRVGAALGDAIAPVLGPAGHLAPQIGEQLGRMIGSRFGGELTASMTMQTELGGLSGAGGGSGTSVGGGESTPGSSGDSSGGASAPEPSIGDTGGGTVVEGAGPAASTAGSGNIVGKTNPDGSRWEYVAADPELGTSAGWALFTPPKPDEKSNSVPKAAVPAGFNLGVFIPDEDGTPRRMVQTPTGLSWIDLLTGNAGPSGSQLPKAEVHQYNPYDGNFTDLVTLAAHKVGTDLGTLLAPVLGANAPEDFAQLAQMLLTPLGQAYSSADPNHDWTNTLGYWIKNLTGIEWSPTGAQGSPAAAQLTNEQQIGVSTVSSAISGLQQHGLLGGLTGAISGAASTAGSAIGSAIGTMVAPFLGPAAALGPAVGAILGSTIGSMFGEELTRPIQWAGNAVKELVGTGFGLTDLAEGPGGHTVRGDIYNFNGTDPKSATIAVERVRRRRAVAQQRGGGFGR